MPTLQIATVGMTIEPILEGFQFRNADRFVLLHSNETDDEAKTISDRVSSFLGRSITELREIDAYDMKSIVGAIIWYRRKYSSWSIDLNVTGGTNIMASAALVAGFAIEARVFYVRAPSQPPEPLAERVIDLPVPKVPLESLSDVQRAILRAVRAKRGELTAANSVLAARLGKSRQVISYHLRQLATKGLLELRVRGKEKIATLTAAGELFAALS